MSPQNREQLDKRIETVHFAEFARGQLYLEYSLNIKDDSIGLC